MTQSNVTPTAADLDPMDAAMDATLPDRPKAMFGEMQVDTWLSPRVWG